jgi:hypothetical protein
VVTAEQLIERMRDASDGGAADRLALIMIDQLFAEKISAVLPAAALAQSLRQGLQGLLASENVLSELERWVEDTVNRLNADRRSLREAASSQLREQLLELTQRPYSPDRRVVLTILDRPPMRALIRSLVLQTVTAFASKMAAPAASVTKGLSGLARIAAEQVKSRGGALGGLVGAVSNEVSHQVERRAAEFADAAISGVLAEIADSLSDPKRAHEAAQLRMEALKGALELTGPQLARELINLDVPGGAKVLREGLSNWLASPKSQPALEAAARSLAMDRSVAELAEKFGQREALAAFLRQLLRARLASLFGSAEYAAWLQALMR